ISVSGRARILLVLVLVALTSVVPGNASAGAGWYLVEPPVYLVDEKGNPLDDAWTVPPKTGSGAPLSEWEHRNSFDSAADCETVRMRRFDEAKRVLASAVPGGWGAMSAETRVKRVLAGQTLAARCIASDDVRLK